MKKYTNKLSENFEDKFCPTTNKKLYTKEADVTNRVVRLRKEIPSSMYCPKSVIH